MAREIELRVINIKPADIRKRLEALEAQLVHSGLQRRFVYDAEPGNTNKWIRLRDTGSKIQLGVKEIIDSAAVDGMEEVEITVDDFDQANNLLAMIGIKPRSYQENYRSLFELDGVEIAIDQWPLLQPFIELEASSKEAITSVLERLGYTEADTTLQHPVDMYREIGIDVKTIPELRFETSPIIN